VIIRQINFWTTKIFLKDCSLVVKMVGFGHHRKFRHRESRLLLARQSVKDAEDSSNSDSNDDCQGFLLSPPHHHLSVASTSEASSIFEGHQWRTTHPLDPRFVVFFGDEFSYPLVRVVFSGLGEP